MSKSIGIISIKGGVGKTTVAASIASDLVNTYGKRVLLVDANFSAPNLGHHMDVLKPQATIGEVLDGSKKITDSLNNRYGVDVIAGGDFDFNKASIFKLKDRIDRIKNAYDYVVIDSSPNLNTEVLPTMLASDLLFVVSTPDLPTLSCSMKAAELAKNRGKPIAGVIVNKIRNPRYELSLQEIEKSTGIPVVARIADEDCHVKSVYSRIPVSIYDKKSNFAKEITQLNAAITGMKQEPSFWKRIFGSNMRKEEVNRGLLKDKFYQGIFDN
ncbi:MAG: MinD/ParA family protein [Nanoarchaeota archaeon]